MFSGELSESMTNIHSVEHLYGTLKLFKINMMIINKVIQNITNILELGKQEMKFLKAKFSLGIFSMRCGLHQQRKQSPK